MINFIYVSEYLAYKLIGNTTKKKTNGNKMLKIINTVVKLDL